jgi:hypothetical protein
VRARRDDPNNVVRRVAGRALDRGREGVGRGSLAGRWHGGRPTQMRSSGESGIRTHETLARLHDFESCAIDQLGHLSICEYTEWPGRCQTEPGFERNVSTAISGGQFSRMGGEISPSPRLTYSTVPPTDRSPEMRRRPSLVGT